MVRVTVWTGRDASGSNLAVRSSLLGWTETSLNGCDDRTRRVFVMTCPVLTCPRSNGEGETVTAAWTDAETATGIDWLVESLVKSVISSLKNPLISEGSRVAVRR